MTLYEPSPADKIVPIACGVLLLTFFAAMPFIARDANNQKERMWQNQGCQMYDNIEATKVPAKCSSYFIDHYKPQEMRNQP